ncbi:MAG: peptidylprolyl isomerase [Pseudomonadota bacterium]
MQSIENHKTSSTEAIRGVRFTGMVLARAAQELHGSTMLRAIFCAALLTATSLETIRLGVVRPPQVLASATENLDPVVASIGDQVLRVSDAYAQAAFTGAPAGDAGDVGELLSSGTVDAAANQVALAQAARTEGIDEALEIRAALALAERQILAEAYLEQVTRAAVSEQAIHARYKAEQEALAAQAVMRVSHIVVPSRDEALVLAAQLPAASFPVLASRHSIDAATSPQGGRMGELRAADLHPTLRQAVDDLRVGQASSPVETEQGWHIVKLEARREVRLAPLNERRPAIVEALTQEAIAAALDDAREAVPMRIRPAESVVAMLNDDEPTPTLALARAQ